MRKGWIVFTILFLLVLATDAYPGLRGGAGWRWPYALPESAGPVVVLAVLLLVYLAGVFYLRRRESPTGITLLWSLAGGVLIAIGVVGVRGDVGFLLFTRTVSPVQTGASTVAVSLMAGDGLENTLERWPEVMRDARNRNIIHFATSPPGQPVLHYGAARLLDDLPALDEPLSLALRPYQCSNRDVMSYTRGEIGSVGLGMLMPVWTALAALPVYAAARLLTEDTARARRLAVWWPLVPTVLLFAPTWNTVYPGLAVTSLALLLAGLRHSTPPVTAAEPRRRRLRLPRGCLYVVLAGAVMSFTTFLNFAVLPVLLLLGLFTLGYGVCCVDEPGAPGGASARGNRLKRVRWAVRVGAWFGLGLSSVWIVFGLVSGLAPLDLWRVTLAEHGALVQRDYLPWLILHPYDVLLFAGWPLAGLFLWGAGMALRRLWNRAGTPLGGQPRNPLRPGEVLALATLLTVILVDLSGVAQGENGRIMSYYAPFFLLSGGSLLAGRFREPGRGELPARGVGDWDAPLLAAQALTVLVMAVALPVVPLDLNPRPEGPYDLLPDLDWPDPTPVGATFRSPQYHGAFRLESFWYVADVGAQVITLVTRWEGVAQVERPYGFEIVARAANEIDGEIVTAPFVWYAQGGHYLPTCWRSGDSVADLVQLPLPTVSAPVVWTLELRAVDARTGDVMRITRPDGAVSDTLILARVNYP